MVSLYTIGESRYRGDEDILLFDSENFVIATISHRRQLELLILESRINGDIVDSNSYETFYHLSKVVFIVAINYIKNNLINLCNKI